MKRKNCPKGLKNKYIPTQSDLPEFWITGDIDVLRTNIFGNYSIWNDWFWVDQITERIFRRELDTKDKWSGKRPSQKCKEVVIDEKTWKESWHCWITTKP